MTSLNEDIIKALEGISAEVTSLRSVSRRAWTKCIKQTMANLGNARGFKVCASGCQNTEDGEWLYDMTWYEMDAAGNFSRQPMVLESEYFPDSHMDGDFHKLVQARAEIRVWVFIAANSLEVDAYIERCKEQAQRFIGSVPGDNYVCMGFNWADSDVTIRSFQV